MYSSLCRNCCRASGNPTVFSKRLLLARKYHSDGVFGFRRKPKSNYQVDEAICAVRNRESNFYRLVEAYRRHGHKIADINPVALSRNISHRPELELSRYGLEESDTVTFKGIINNGKDEGTVGDALKFLNEVYTKTISAEYTYVEKEEEIEWLNSRLENLANEKLDAQARKTIARELIKSQVFDNFLATKLPAVKRYGGEGAESMMAFFTEFLKLSAQDGLEEIVMCMPHRGRLNLLTGLLQFPPAKLFMKLKGRPDFPEHFQSTGDVISHCISSVDMEIESRKLHVTMLYNPSHLEAVNPVSMGKTRAKQMEHKDGDYSDSGRWSDKILNLQVHGDAAFSAQGINQECLGLSAVPHFEIGGSVHLVVNNQLGFTTPAERGRSSRYCTDLAKFIGAPVLHVNGDYPEAVLKATRMAFEYQRKFRRDIFIDMNCYRQWGHNEVDDPTFTNPSLYRIIHSRGTVPDQYSKQLIEEGVITQSEVDDIVREHSGWLTEHLKQAETYSPEAPCFNRQWSGFMQAQNVISTWDTGLNTELLTTIGTKSVWYPQTFKVHPHLLEKHVKARLSKVAEGEKLDWATAEAMAIGSLLYQGYNVRISGQDVGRGTFSHRHVMLVDQDTNNIHIPLNNLHAEQSGFLEVANSILSEEAVLGFEYGMSVESPRNLIIWEAQFGDFFNGAQIIIDTFVSSGEAKWLWSSGLVMLLPHGYDGAGPEHSSARIERFLQLTDSKENKPDGDNVNMEVCQPSTPAQYFHLLRRQMTRNFRKPLVIIAPKTLLRLSACTSNLAEFEPGTWFQPVIGEKLYDNNKVQKVVFCSGKHYYSLLAKKQSSRNSDTALVRLESFCPFPTLNLQEEVAKYPNAKVFIWSQEEPRNMGAWTFVKPRFENLVGKKIHYCGRDTLPTPAVGVAQWHQKQAEEVVNSPFTFDPLKK